jgi:formiminoglutamase
VHREVVRQILRDGKTLLVLGGGNDTSYPDCSALALESDHDLLALNINAHYDVRADAVRNSGTPYRQLLEEGDIAPERFYEIGGQPFANSPTYRAYLTGNGAKVISLDDALREGLSPLLGGILALHPVRAIFWGLDMDEVTAGDAPGVSAINPAGMSARDFCQIAALAGADARSRLFEITEVNPVYDIDGRTCRLAAAALWTFLAAYEER